MRTLLGFLTALALVLSLRADAEGHLPADFTYYAVQFPDTYLPVLDGDLVEWDIISDAYMIYSEDMYNALYGLGGKVPPELSNLALRTCCGWNDSTNRLYFMAEVFDDIHQTDRTDPQCNWTDDCWEIVIDANHSGGRHAWFSDMTEEESKRLEGSEGTQYIVTEPPVQGVDVTSGNASTWTSERGDWFDIGWGFVGEQFGESTYYYELFIYPFDDLNWEGPDVSTHHDLTEGEILGIGLLFGDFDASSDNYDDFWRVSGGDATCGLSEALADFRLQPVEQGVFQPLAVEEISWGRMKTERAR